MYILHFVHSSVGGQFGCFHLLAIVNRSARNIEVFEYLFPILLQMRVYVCLCVVMVLLGHMVCVKVFEKLLNCIVPEPIDIPCQKCTRVCVFPHICQCLLFNFFLFLNVVYLSKSFAIFYLGYLSFCWVLRILHMLWLLELTRYDLEIFFPIFFSVVFSFSQ